MSFSVRKAGSMFGNDGVAGLGNSIYMYIYVGHDFCKENRIEDPMALPWQIAPETPAMPCCARNAKTFTMIT